MLSLSFRGCLDTRDQLCSLTIKGACHSNEEVGATSSVPPRQLPCDINVRNEPIGLVVRSLCGCFSSCSASSFLRIVRRGILFLSDQLDGTSSTEIGRTAEPATVSRRQRAKWVGNFGGEAAAKLPSRSRAAWPPAAPRLPPRSRGGDRPSTLYAFQMKGAPNIAVRGSPSRASRSVPLVLLSAMARDIVACRRTAPKSADSMLPK